MTYGGADDGPVPQELESMIEGLVNEVEAAAESKASLAVHLRTNRKDDDDDEDGGDE